MSAILKVPVVIENVAGANGSIGTGRVARATPDGYTLVLGGGATHVFNGALLPLTYDLAAEFAPVSLVSFSAMLIVGSKSVPASSVSDLVAWIKANPDKATLGTTNTAAQLLATLFQKQSGTRLQFIPYRGAAPAIQDLVAGQIALIMDSPAPLLP